MMYICHREEERERTQNDNFAIKLAEGYINWISEKCSKTTDKVLQMVLNYVQLKELYATQAKTN